MSGFRLPVPGLRPCGSVHPVNELANEAVDVRCFVQPGNEAATEAIGIR
jgi:hypothetical protein